jgi:hypothetical protein
MGTEPAELLLQQPLLCRAGRPSRSGGVRRLRDAIGRKARFAIGRWSFTSHEHIKLEDSRLHYRENASLL